MRLFPLPPHILFRPPNLLVGGIVGDTFGIVRPFQVAFFLFCLSSIYALSTMPYISPESLTSTNGKPGSGSGSGSGSNQKRRGGLAGFFEPLKVLAPQRIRLNTGRVVKHYGVFFLCSGVFLGVVRISRLCRAFC